MAPQDILRKFKAVPFSPVRLYLTDGSVHDVQESSQAHVFATEVIIGYDPDQYGLPTRSVYVAPNHVTRIEPITPAAAPER